MRAIVSMLVVAVVLVYAGCDSVADEGGSVHLEGLVLDAENEPVPSAFVRIQPFDEVVETNAAGFYTTEIEIDSSMQVVLLVTKDGYTDASTSIYAVADRVIQVPTIHLQQTAGQAPISGEASNILLLELSAQSIGVKESGAQEVATITFQLADSLGRPVVIDHAADVRFQFGAHPDGGEFIHPTRSETDNNGRVTVHLSSGTRAGAVQLIAETQVGDRTIRSKPVSIAIHGGLPDQLHFSLGPEQFNYPGLLAYGLVNPVSVVVGDKYANPVKPETVVYFTTDHCVIEGSVVTDAEGRGTVNFISANPLPPQGITVVTARTADENSNDVEARIPMVLTGFPRITFAAGSPLSAVLGVTYEVTIADRNGNPLVEGTQITVVAEGNRVKAVGHTDVQLGRTGFFDANGDGDIFDYEDIVRGPGITEFTFRAVADDSGAGEGDPELEAIVITVTGPNGNLEVVLTPQGTFAASKHAVVSDLPDGRRVVLLEQ